MNKILYLIFIVVNISFLYQPASALKITSPIENEIVYAGSQMTVIAKPDPGEEWISVSVGIDPMTYNPFTKEYKTTVPVPRDYYGYYDNLIVFAADKNNKSVELRRTVFVKLPSNVILKSIEINPNPLFLEKLPPDSSADDIRVFGTRTLKVMGLYSDNVKRKLGASESGTTYTNGNDKVVTVDTEGKVVAQGVGKATITVRNGKLSVDVRVIVEPYKD